MQTYDIKYLEQEFTLHYPEVLALIVTPEGPGLAMPAGKLPWVPVLFAKVSRI